MKSSPMHERFDKAYFRRFYQDPKTRAISPAAFTRLGDFVCAALRYLEQPVKRVVDLGCGLGAWQAVITRHFPNARYYGVEVSAYLCERYGWHASSVVDFRSRWPFDLVICNDVLQYLDDDEAAEALENLGRLCRGVLYFGALTEEDWAKNCDRERTDEVGFLRGGDWYRHHLSRHFENMGGGLFVSRASSIVLYDLERLA